MKSRLVPAGTTNLTCIGSIGKISMATVPSVTNQQINSIIAKEDITDPLFVYYMIRNWRKTLKREAAGSVTPIINKTVLSNYLFNVPPLSEQRAIAEVLGALDDKIAANKEIFKTIEALGIAKFTQLGLDTDSGQSAVPLTEFFEVNPRRTVLSDEPTIISMQSLPTSEPLIEDWEKGKRKGGTRFANGDTLLARITPCLENRKTAFVDFLADGEIGIGSTEFIVLRSREGLPLGLSYFMAISSKFRDFAIQNMVGTSGRQRVSAQDVSRYMISPVDESALRNFGEWADTNLVYLGSLRDENNVLSQTRDALLPQLMSGKMRVRDAEAVVEDAL